MAWRTTEAEVRAVVDSITTISMAPFINKANALVDYVVSQDTASVLTTALLREIENSLAAHFYSRRDPQYQQKSTGRASAVFQGQTSLKLKSTYHGQDALTLDVTGTLSKLNRDQHQVEIAWLGKVPTDQVEYEDRD